MSETVDKAALRKAWRWVWTGIGVLGVLAAVAVVAAPRAWASLEAERAPFGGHGPRGLGARAMYDPATARRHAAFALEWVLRGVDASDEQRQKARAVAERLVDQLAPLAERHHANREAIASELGKAEIDREALERLRQSEIALADTASGKALGAVLDLADVLTPEQRREILDLARNLHGQEPPSVR